jgi:hypothetical protein
LRTPNKAGIIQNFIIPDPETGLSQKNSKEEVMVSLTDSAVVKFKEVVTKQGAAGDGVRIFVVPGG